MYVIPEWVSRRSRTSRSTAAQTFLPPFYPDELVYSYAARYAHHRSLAANAVNLSLFGRENGTVIGLPNRLQWLANHFHQPTMTAERIAWSHTLLPYLTAFHAPARRQRTIAAMVGDHEISRQVGGTAYTPFRTPARLRFCVECHLDMLENTGEPYWRRTHQIPIATICPDHGIPLRASRVEIKSSTRVYHHPSAEACPDDAPPVVDQGTSDSDMAALREVSVEARRLLVDGDSQIDRSPMPDDILSILRSKGYAGPNGQFAFDKLRPTIDRALAPFAAVFPEVLDRRPGYSAPVWLTRLRQGGMRPTAATVLLAQRVAAAAPTLVSPFGSGPWECRNPVSDHRGALTISAISRQVIYGDGFRALFECPCGFAYTRQSHADGSVGEPRFSRFGPSLRAVIDRARKQGLSLWVTANGVDLQVVALLNAMEKEGISIHWENLPRAYREGRAKRRAKASGSTPPSGREAKSS